MFSGVVVNFIGLLNPEVLILNDCKMKLALPPVQIRVFNLGIPLLFLLWKLFQFSVYPLTVCSVISGGEACSSQREEKTQTREEL